MAKLLFLNENLTKLAKANKIFWLAIFANKSLFKYTILDMQRWNYISNTFVVLLKILFWESIIVVRLSHFSCIDHNSKSTTGNSMKLER